MKSFVYTKYSTECKNTESVSIYYPKCATICSLGGNVQDLVMDNSRIANETSYGNSSLTVAAYLWPAKKKLDVDTNGGHSHA